MDLEVAGKTVFLTGGATGIGWATVALFAAEGASVSEFQLAPGAALEPHSDDSDEFYDLLEGEAVMTVAGEEREVRAGDLIRTPPNTIDSIRTIGDGTFRALAFATSYMPADRVGYTTYPEGGDARFVPHGEE